jgi:hypothetical protein
MEMIGNIYIYFFTNGMPYKIYEVLIDEVIHTKNLCIYYLH